MKYVRFYKFYFCKILARIGVLKMFNWWVNIKRGGRKFSVPVFNGIGYYNLSSFSEPWMGEMIKRFCNQRQGCIIDVGVNLAQTLLKIASINDKVEYYGFEPNPVCYNYSTQFTKRNHLPNFKIFPVGLSNENAVVKLYGDNDYASGATIIEGFRNNKSKYQVIHYVPVMNGDTLLKDENIGPINFVKIDVEGSELVVIEGMQNTLREKMPLIIMEILPVYNLDSENGQLRKERQDKMLHLLQSLGYIMFLIKEDEIMLQAMESIPVHGDMGKTNYLFVAKSQLHDVNDMIEG